MTGGSGFDAAIVGEVKRELGITLQAETLGDDYFDRLASDPPQMWALAWVADYPGRNDFLGVLLNTGASNNYGHWSSPDFDAATLEATSATDPAKASAAYDRAERIVRDEVPVVPAGLRTGLGAVADRASRCGPERPRHRAHGGTGVGELMRTAPAHRSRARRPIAALLALGLLLGLVPTVAGASSWTFGTPTADSTFEKGIVFSQPITIDKPIGRVEILLTFAGRRSGRRSSWYRACPSGPTATLTYTLDTSGNDHMIPNTPIVAQWRVVSAGQPAEVALGPQQRVVYDDDRFQWKTTSDELVRVHWYEGDAAFGAKALKLGADEVRKTSQLLGVTESDPIDFFVYANVDDFYGAIGPGAHENVAGSAYAEIRTLLGLIPPGQINDSLVAVRIPHEFVHMVFDTASKNPYHSPPRWLNEGLAVYQSEGYGSSDRGAVQSAARNGSLIPLDGLTGQFPNGQDFFLAYSESVSSVDFMIRTYGPDALVKLIRSYADGRTDDEAFSAALGLDMTAFGDAWFKDVKATPKAKSGPQPAPPGPVPSAWTGAAPGSQASGRAGQRRRRCRRDGCSGSLGGPGQLPARPAVTAERWSACWSPSGSS